MSYYTTNNFSSFWSDYRDTSSVDELLGIEEKKHTGRDLIALASYRRAISNFVNIVSGKSIPVEFNSNDQSYTDGKKVVLGANLNDKNFDVAVGLALHEGSHNLLSDFKLLHNLHVHISDEIYAKASILKIERETVDVHIKRILNYIEDRRIDHYIFKTSPGYKGYYHSMYEKYFYNKNIDKALLSSEYRTEDWKSYDFRLINLHNSNRQLNALNGMRDIWKEINLPNIARLTSSTDVLEVALKVYEIILRNIEPEMVNDSNSDNTQEDGMESSDRDGGDEISNGAGSSNNEIDSSDDDSSDKNNNDDDSSDKNNNDDGSELSELSDRQKSIVEKAFEKQKDFVDGNIKKTKLSKKDAGNMKALEDSGATYEEVGENVGWNNDKVKCLVVKNLTAGLIESNQFSVADSYSMNSYGTSSSWSNYNFVEEGLRLGSVLGRKLKVRSENRTTKYTRKESGKIDKRMLAELGFGNANVFSQTMVDSYNKAYVHLSIDASGSMSGTPWNKAMTSAVAMIKACDMAGNIDVVVSIRSTHGGGTHNNELPLIMVVYDSRKDKLTKVRTLFKSLRTAGTTPEGLCFEAIAKDLIPGNSKQDSYFINYSDGAPMYSGNGYYYRGSEALLHTKKQVKNMRNLGLKVMSYFISEGRYGNDSFKTMYGKDAHFIDATNMMEVARTMNKKFLER
jgi:hypothetical protein